MRNHLLTLILLLVFIGANAQSSVSSDATVSLDDLLISITDDLECTSISNITSPNNSALAGEGFNSFATFQFQYEPNFPFDNGIVLTTHDASDLSSVLNSGSTSWPGDPDLEALIQESGNTYNATVVEFDFTPFREQISVDYVLASNEYPTFVCDYTDTFAFIVSGPGISDVHSYDHDANPNTPEVNLDLGGINIATIPGTSIPVSPPNIHNDNSCLPGDMGEFAVGQLFDDQSSDINVLEYSGQTVPLTAQLDVTPGQTYHIKLVIGDRGDSILDSAVFIDADSFTIGTIPENLPYDPSFVNNMPDCWMSTDAADYEITNNCAPNGENYLKLNGGDYNIETAAVDASNESAITVDFQVFNGCDDVAEAGKNLIIEYFDGSEWNDLDIIDPVDLPSTSLNGSSDNWVAKSYMIDSGLSMNFKLRFSRNGGLNGLDDISISNLSIESENLSADTFDEKKAVIYPNPVEDILNIELEQGQSIDQVKLMDMSGKTVRQFKPGGNGQIDLGNIRTGVYILKLRIGQETVIKRLIKR